MKEGKCLDKLSLLYAKSLDLIVEACIYNIFDLARCIKYVPGYTDKIIEMLLANDNYVRRIFDSEHQPAVTMKKLETKFPSYKERFSAAYTKLYPDNDSRPRP